VVPCVGLLELGAHAMQTRAVVPERDWIAARTFVEAQAKPEDLVTFAPRWADPLGRHYFGAAMATIEREARADESRFRRAFEVGIRGAHSSALGLWQRADERHFGGVTVTTWDNPTPAPAIDDLVSMVNPASMRVSSGGNDCPFVRGPGQSGGLGFGPAIPGSRFACPTGSFAGVSVVADLEYIPRRCLYVPPSGGGPTHLQFLGVRFGGTLQGHHALYVEAERNKKGPPVTIQFSVDGAVLGNATHRDGDGWAAFSLDTAGLAGRRADLVAEISSTDRRSYCFEATTR
jgi:hypothetical protein